MIGAWIVSRVKPDGEIAPFGEPFSLLEAAETDAKVKSAKLMCPYVIQAATREGRKLKSLATPTGLVVDYHVAPVVIEGWVKANAALAVVEKAQVGLKEVRTDE